MGSNIESGYVLTAPSFRSGFREGLGEDSPLFLWLFHRKGVDLQTNC